MSLIFWISFGSILRFLGLAVGQMNSQISESNLNVFRFLLDFLEFFGISQKSVRDFLSDLPLDSVTLL